MTNKPISFVKEKTNSIPRKSASKRMKSNMDWNKDIVNIATIINQEFPELLKTIRAMDVLFTENNKEETNMTTLEEFFLSLMELIVKNPKPKPSEKLAYIINQI